MQKVNKKYLYLPFIIAMLAYCLDKILFLDSVKPLYSKTLSEINYLEKPKLFEKLKLYLQLKDRKKVVVFLGNSRSLLFDLNYIHTNYPEWTFYNFSVPGGSPDYFYYWIEKFLEENLKPEFIVFDQSIEIFNKNSLISLDENLVYGVSTKFILENYNLYDSNKVFNSILKKNMASYCYKPKLQTVLSRIDNDFAVYKSFIELRNTTIKNLEKNNGSATPDKFLRVVLPEKILEERAIGDFNTYMHHFEIDASIVRFSEKSFQSLNDQKIKFSSISVRVSRPYFSLFKFSSSIDQNEKHAYRKWLLLLNQMNKKYHVKYWNMNEDKNYHCDDFSDPGHMSPNCFKDYTDYIFKNITESNY